MKLSLLEPIWVRKTDVGYREVATKAEAQGVRFLCPKCYAANSGPIGTHQIICWSRTLGVPDGATPGPGRWTFAGELANLTINGDPPGNARSVQLNGGCAWHGHVTDGEAV